MREHGTRARYVWGPDENDQPGAACRCDGCTAANRSWNSHRDRMMLYGRWQPYVDAGPAREHVRLLGECGIGWKQVAALAGVATSTVSKLLYGGPGHRPPTRRIRPQTEAAILAVLPLPGNLGNGALVDATATRRRLQALVATGRPKAYLAARLGMQLRNFIHLLERRQVLAATERAVAALYDELWVTPPPEETHRQKISASRARNYARARGWALPQQWDDDTIGDPEAMPAERRQDGKYRNRAELVEEARELLGLGLTRNQAAERLGVSVNALNLALARTRREDVA